MPAPDMVQVFALLKASGEMSSDEVIAALKRQGEKNMLTWCYAPALRDWASMGFLSRRDSSGSDPGRKRGTPVYRVTEKGEAQVKAMLERREQLAREAAEPKPPTRDFED